MRVVLAAALCATLTLPAMAGDFPKSPKIGPPGPLPDAICDPSVPSDGEWVVGNWVAPRTKWIFARDGADLVWTMERKAQINEGFGWRDGATITGTVERITGCTIALKAGEGAFSFEGVLTDRGQLFGYATNTKGDNVRFTLRRER